MGQELSSPSAGWAMEKKTGMHVPVASRQRGAAEAREGFSAGVDGEKCFRVGGEVCIWSWKLSRRAGGKWWLLTWNGALKCCLCCLDLGVKLCRAEREQLLGH